MSCAERGWESALDARRDGGDRGELDGVLSETERRHLGACGECRREAVRRDPTIAFVLELAQRSDRSGGAMADEAEVRAMRDAMRAMRRGADRDGWMNTRGPSRAGWIAAALLGGVALFAGPASPPVRFEATPEPARVARAGFVPATVELGSELTVPLIEDLDRPARIYELADGRDDLSLVLIVDASLEL